MVFPKDIFGISFNLKKKKKSVKTKSMKKKFCKKFHCLEQWGSNKVYIYLCSSYRTFSLNTGPEDRLRLSFALNICSKHKKQTTYQENKIVVG